MSRNRNILSVHIDVDFVLRGIAIASVAVVGLGLFRESYIFLFGSDTVLQDLRQIALDTENCVASWYSSLLMFVAALLLAAMARAAEMRPWRPHLIVLAILFVLLSLDETASFHEALIDPLRGAFDLTGFLHFAWIVPGAVGCAVLGAIYLPFVMALPPGLKWTIVAAGAIYLTGALGFEAIGGHCVTVHGKGSGCHIAAFLIEESLEVLGLTVFVFALAKYIRERYYGVTLSLAPEVVQSQSVAASKAAV